MLTTHHENRPSRARIDELITGLIKGKAADDLRTEIMKDPESKAYYDKMTFFLKEAETSKTRVASRLLARDTLLPSHRQLLHRLVVPPSPTSRFGIPFAVGMLIVVGFFLARQPIQRNMTFKGSSPTEKIFVKKTLTSGLSSVHPFTGTVQTGDHVKFVIFPQHRHLFIVSIQANSEIFNFMPMKQSRSIALDTSIERLEMSGGIRFDDYPKDEDILFIYSEKAIDLVTIRQSILEVWQQKATEWDDIAIKLRSYGPILVSRHHVKKQGLSAYPSK